MNWDNERGNHNLDCVHARSVSLIIVAAPSRSRPIEHIRASITIRIFSISTISLNSKFSTPNFFSNSPTLFSTFVYNTSSISAVNFKLLTFFIEVFAEAFLFCVLISVSLIPRVRGTYWYTSRDQILVVISSLKIAPEVTEKVAQVDFDRASRVDCYETTEKPEETSCFYELSVSLPIRPKS